MHRKKDSFSVLKSLGLFIVLIFVTTFMLSDLLAVSKVDASIAGLPAPTDMVGISSSLKDYAVLKGVRINPESPLDLEFIVDAQYDKELTDQDVSELIKYFLAAVTLPKEELWVNLSPYENDRVATDAMSVTDMGKGLLAQDYILKQLSSSLTHPDTELGKKYWNDVSSADSFNKIWIVPEKAEVYENGASAFITRATLNVLTDADYNAMQKNGADAANTDAVKKIILPELYNEVNSGKNFAVLRQIYNSIILGLWFKDKFSDSMFKHYIDNDKTDGIDIEDRAVKQKIWTLYCEAFKKGVYNINRKAVAPDSAKKVRKVYFSGGATWVNADIDHADSALGAEALEPNKISVKLETAASSMITLNHNPDMIQEEVREFESGGLAFSLGAYAGKVAEVVTVDDNTKKLVNKRGQELTLEVFPYDEIQMVKLNGVSYMPGDNAQTIDISRFNFAGNVEYVDFFDVDFEKVDPADIQFPVPFVEPDKDKFRHGHPFPANIQQQYDLAAVKHRPSQETIDNSLLFVYDFSVGRIKKPNFSELIHHLAVIGIFSDPYAYFFAQDTAGDMLKMHEYASYRQQIIDFKDYIDNVLDGRNWIKHREYRDRILSGEFISRKKGFARVMELVNRIFKITGLPELNWGKNSKTRKKTIFEITRTPEELGYKDMSPVEAEDWEIDDIEGVKFDEMPNLSDPKSLDPEILKSGLDNIAEAANIALPVMGGIAKTIRDDMFGNKMTLPAMLVKTNKTGDKYKFISFGEARIGFLLGQNPKSNIAAVLNVTSSKYGDSLRSIYEQLAPRFAKEIESGQLKFPLQRSAVPLDIKTGMMVRHKDGFQAPYAENHYFAGEAFWGSFDNILEAIENNHYFVALGNGDNPLNRTQAGMMGMLAKAEKEGRKVTTLAGFAPPLDDRKGGKPFRVTFRNKKDPTKTVTRYMILELSALPTRGGYGFDAIDISKLKNGTREEKAFYKKIEEKGWFVEDLLLDEKGNEIGVGHNIAFYGLNVKFLLAAMFGLDPLAEDLVDQFKKIHEGTGKTRQQFWMDTLHEWEKKIAVEIKPDKGVPDEIDARMKAVGLCTDQPIQYLIVNLIYYLGLEMEFAGLDRKFFTPFKNTRQAFADQNGKAIEGKFASDIIANQNVYVNAVQEAAEQGQHLQLGNGEYAIDAMPVEWRYELIYRIRKKITPDVDFDWRELIVASDKVHVGKAAPVVENQVDVIWSKDEDVDTLINRMIEMQKNDKGFSFKNVVIHGNKAHPGEIDRLLFCLKGLHALELKEVTEFPFLDNDIIFEEPAQENVIETRVNAIRKKAASAVSAAENQSAAAVSSNIASFSERSFNNGGVDISDIEVSSALGSEVVELNFKGIDLSGIPGFTFSITGRNVMTQTEFVTYVSFPVK